MKNLKKRNEHFGLSDSKTVNFKTKTKDFRSYSIYLRKSFVMFRNIFANFQKYISATLCDICGKTYETLCMSKNSRMDIKGGQLQPNSLCQSQTILHQKNFLARAFAFSNSLKTLLKTTSGVSAASMREWSPRFL